DGVAMSQWSAPELARRRAMLSQKVQLGFAFRVEEVAMLGRSPYTAKGECADDHRIVDAALRAAHAWHLRGRPYSELSGGEQQRVQLARVLAQVWENDGGPSWLLLDEPEAGLDIAHQHFVLQQARRMTRQGWGVIAVLHDLNLAVRYADDVALLEQGKLLRYGSPVQALDPEVLSTVYGLPLRRVSTDGDGWVLLPA
ncbi:MAG: ATP-binding cassette domain-containing protein, partial [Rhodanobacter sp.]